MSLVCLGGEWWSYLTIILPLAALDTLASLQILESVKAAGDDFATRPSLLMNGVGTLVAACLGSPFPTTLYVGHAAHKANGARSGYSALNGVVTLVLCMTGVLPLVLRVIPLEVAGPVIVWFGLVTVGQAFHGGSSEPGSCGGFRVDSDAGAVGYDAGGARFFQGGKFAGGDAGRGWGRSWR
jgi:xanthine/uracil/vitamin C permease (AzgA family)